MTRQPDWMARVLEAGQADVIGSRWTPIKAMPQPRDSAILMLFGANAIGGEDVILTERSSSMRKHAGQVSFPGGGVEPGDSSLTHTALREAQEEIGLRADGVTVLGELTALPLHVSNFLVHPVLAWWEQPHEVSAVDPAEVAKVARVRLDDLANPDNRFNVRHPLGYTGPAWDIDGLYIWGFTGFVLDAVLGVGGLEQPWDKSNVQPLPERFLKSNL